MRFPQIALRGKELQNVIEATRRGSRNNLGWSFMGRAHLNEDKKGLTLQISAIAQPKEQENSLSGLAAGGQIFRIPLK